MKKKGKSKYFLPSGRDEEGLVFPTTELSKRGGYIFPWSLCVTWAITSCCPHGRREAAWGSDGGMWRQLGHEEPSVLSPLTVLDTSQVKLSPYKANLVCSKSSNCSHTVTVHRTWELLQGRWFPWQTEPQQHGKGSGHGPLKPRNIRCIAHR